MTWIVNGPIPLYHIVTYERFSWLIIMGSRLDDWIYWHFYNNYNQLWQLKINDCVRLAQFLAGLRVSSLLRDWLGSDLRVDHFFSFICSLVNTAQLNADLSREWIHQSHEFTNELSFITLWEPKRGHHLEQLVVILPLSREYMFGNRWLANGLWLLFVAIPTFRRCLPNHCIAYGHIRHNMIKTMIMTMSVRMGVTMMAMVSWFQFF
jgi:hypothetical protein